MYGNPRLTSKQYKHNTVKIFINYLPKLYLLRSTFIWLNPALTQRNFRQSRCVLVSVVLGSLAGNNTE